MKPSLSNAVRTRGRMLALSSPPASVSSKTRRTLQRKCACGGTPEPTGECAECKRKRLQTKLVINQPGDVYEQEADRAAAQVMAAWPHPTRGTVPPRIQRFSADGHGGAENATAPASVTRALAESGKPLEPKLRQNLEQRFAHDFSKVRVHSGGAAEQSAKEVDADAYTIGHHIAFAAGQYAPATSSGLRLIVHELTHVVQQSQAGDGEISSEARYLQRGGKKGPTTKPHSCGGWTCASLSDCPKPDGKSAPGTKASTSWSLTANLDLDVPTADEIAGGDDVGHAFAQFDESNGDRYTYGHYPNKSSTPDPVFHPSVPGCTAHPDQTHTECVDMRVAYTLAEPEYKAALKFAQAWCGSAQPYHVLTNNCTTFVEGVVKAASKTIPSSRGSVGHGTFTADNPNTLFDTQLSQADKAKWRKRVTGDFEGIYDSSSTVVSFSSFELKTDEKLSVAGDYSFVGSTGDIVEGTIDGRLIFNVDAASKAVSPIVQFKWVEPGGSGNGVWTVSAAGDLKGTWGRGAAESGGGIWEISKKP